MVEMNASYVNDWGGQWTCFKYNDLYFHKYNTS